MVILEKIVVADIEVWYLDKRIVIKFLKNTSLKHFYLAFSHYVTLHTPQNIFLIKLDDGFQLKKTKQKLDFTKILEFKSFVLLLTEANSDYFDSGDSSRGELFGIEIRYDTVIENKINFTKETLTLFNLLK